MINENNYFVGARHGEPFRHKIDRHSIRIKHWDYSENGYYFVTINTHEGKYLLGKIKEREMIKSPIGEIVEKYFKEIPNHFEDVEIDQFQVMPNHLHGIIIIHHVGVRHGEPLHKFQKTTPQSISVMINLFKQAVTIWCNKNNFFSFQWQRNFYEHVIRNEAELLILQTYIVNNPLKWHLDKNNFESKVPLKKRGAW